MNIRPGDLILVRGDKWIERGIEWITHSAYSHVAGVCRPNELIEAQGFRRTGYEDLGAYEGQADVYTCDSLTDDQRTQILVYAMSEVGGRYDYLLILIELLRYVGNIILPYKEPPKSRICSTLWRDAYLSAGVDLTPGIRYPSPGDIAQSKFLRKVGSLKGDAM